MAIDMKIYLVAILQLLSILKFILLTTPKQRDIVYNDKVVLQQLYSTLLKVVILKYLFYMNT